MNLKKNVSLNSISTKMTLSNKRDQQMQTESRMYRKCKCNGHSNKKLPNYIKTLIKTFNDFSNWVSLRRGLLYNYLLRYTHVMFYRLLILLLKNKKVEKKS